jgi:hypothetical protein
MRQINGSSSPTNEGRAIMSYSISLSRPNFVDPLRRTEAPALSIQGPSTSPTAGDPVAPSPEPGMEAVASSFRLAWVRSIRAEIRDGAFETPGRIDGTVARLLDILA